MVRNLKNFQTKVDEIFVVGILSLYATLRVDKIQWCATLKLKNWQKFSLRNWQNLIGNGTLKVELCPRMVGEHVIKQGLVH